MGRRKDMKVSRKHLHQPEDKGQAMRELTAAQRLALVWEITQPAWAFKVQAVAEPGLPRHSWRVFKKPR
jgi:hypothetical protein